MDVVTVIAGTGRISDASFVGQTVAALRAQFAGLYNIAATAQALVNGKAVDANYTLRAGDELSFTKPAGEKGV
jgi:molybdopterin converting factor small subunit